MATIAIFGGLDTRVVRSGMKRCAGVTPSSRSAAGKAFVDEIEQPAHRRQRFSVAY